MDPATRRWFFIAMLIAAVGLAACVVRTRPAHRHQHVQSGKHKPDKHKKHKKHHKHHKHH